MFCKTYIFTFFIHPPSFTLARCDKVLESKKIKLIQDNEYIGEKQYTEKLPHGSFWYDEKFVFPIAYIDTHQKKCMPFRNLCQCW